MFDTSPRPELMALLAAVKAEPDDDTAKLVLADWLQEQDDEADRARGEFLREAVRYHRMESSDPTRRDSQARLDALWQRHFTAWVGPLVAAGFHFWGQASRSWLLAPQIDGTQLMSKRAQALANTEAYAWVGGLSFSRLSSQQNRQFIRSPLLVPLIALRYDGCSVLSWAIEELAHAPNAANLKSLDISRVDISSVGIDGIANSPHMARLRRLLLSQAVIRDAGFKGMCNSPHLNELQSLTVLDDRLTIHSARAFADATGLPALTELNLGGTNRIGPDGTLILVNSPKAAQLRKLNLWSNGIADYGVEALCRQAHVCNLTHLDVSGNLLTNRAAVAIAAAEHLKSLEDLNLKTNSLSGEGALALANSPHLANLRRLDLSGNRISEKAAKALRDRFGAGVVLG